MLFCGALIGGRMRLTLILLAVAFFALAIESRAQTRSSSVESQAESIFSSITRENAPGLAVLVRKDGHTLFEKGYGVRDLRSKAKIDQHTNFRLASFTKQFTAMAVMMLVHDGKLRYDEPLTEIFPDFPAYGTAITIRHLLTHTSGLPDYEDLMDGAWTETHQIQDQDVLRLLEKQQ